MEKNEYNSEPVFYCKNCLHLKIKPLEGSTIDYCGNCGGTDIESGDIYDWEDQYFELYGEHYVKRNRKLGTNQGDTECPI